MRISDGYRAKNEELGAPGPFIRAGELNNGFDTQAADGRRRSLVASVKDRK